MPIPPDLQIFYPNGGTSASQMYIWSTIDSKPVVWDGSVTVSVTTSGTAIEDGVTSSIKATVLDLTTSNPLTVAIVDTTGAQIASFGGGVQYSEGTTSTNVTGTVIMWRAAGNAIVPVDSTNKLPVTLAANQSVNVAQINGVTPLMGAGNTGTGSPRVTIASDQVIIPVSAVGTIADDATTPGSPVMIGGSAKLFDGTDPGNVSAEDDVTRVITDTQRRLYVNNVHPQYWSYHTNTTTALSATSVQGDPGANYAIFVTDLVFSTGVATAANISLADGDGTIMMGPYYLEAVAGRGVALHFVTPRKITTHKSLTVTTSASIAQAVDICGFIGKVA